MRPRVAVHHVGVVVKVEGCRIEKICLGIRRPVITHSESWPTYRQVRGKIIGDETLFTSTLVIVEGLASPDILIEIEAWAAKA